ncbi:cytochrome-c oxidase, cbb3-type subunit I [Cardiobacterium hominis]|uniref:cytochrome-c oxidase n=2 Tax=Cardiobacterium hominis TaxID=2718 RepID=C8NCU0_CARH6|nr:cytochrome-c oxidase, cbb3-type subunit I [Cardiobacterium hominis]EEV87565.1 cytochrome c oxidase, cbb3-type, subunit I [Cardiobacterium hominis ATCC 15826]SAM59828.1 Cytochrome c oxidase subunit CcoN [Cardiobacterium hominis]VEG78311.1 Nitric oxide reductase subunit B [Cardiobacterium hominis]
MAMDTPYNYRVVKQFTWAAIIFGVIGMLVGVIIAAQLRWPTLFGGIDFLSYGRLRPVHTSGVIFAFGGNALFATSYYIVQRVCSVRLVSDKIAAFTFYGYQAVLVLGVLSYVLGYSQSKEYAELPWLLDILLAVVWVAYAYVFFFTIGKRKEKHIYVGLWFYGAYIIAVAVLHIFNNLALPIDWLHSYPVYSGAVDAMAQWWYGHNAVGFFLTAAFLGMMYYFVPKQAGRPIYSYRLSIVHFWALISIYMWAGPHHLHYTALPDWTQSLGMAFSVILWVPSWGGMINGMMTLSGAWNKLVTDPIIRFLFVALSFYGMSTFEGPMMAIKEVNALSHYTEWTVGHVHSGALGWVAMITMGSLYHMLPRLYGKTEMYSTRLIFVHFWLATIGIVLYVTSMWVAGIMEGLLWRETVADGSLTYSFIEILGKKYIFYFVRFLGGAFFLSGMCLMAYNCWKTVAGAKQPAAQLQTQPA